MLKKLICRLRGHSVKYTPGTIQKTGFAVAHLIFPLHEYKREGVCERCGEPVTTYGVLPAFPLKDSGDKFSDSGFPIGDDGRNLPLKSKN